MQSEIAVQVTRRARNVGQKDNIHVEVKDEKGDGVDSSNSKKRKTDIPEGPTGCMPTGKLINVQIPSRRAGKGQVGTEMEKAIAITPLAKNDEWQGNNQRNVDSSSIQRRDTADDSSCSSMCADIVAESYNLATQGMYDGSVEILQDQGIETAESTTEDEESEDEVGIPEVSVTTETVGKDFAQLENCNIGNMRQPQQTHHRPEPTCGMMMGGQQPNPSYIIQNQLWTSEPLQDQRQPYNIIQFQAPPNSSQLGMQEHYKMSGQGNATYLPAHAMAPIQNDCNTIHGMKAHHYEQLQIPSSIPVAYHQSGDQTGYFRPMHGAGMMGNPCEMQEYHGIQAGPSMQSFRIGNMMPEQVSMQAMGQVSGRNDNLMQPMMESEEEVIDCDDDEDDDDDDKPGSPMKGKRRKRGRKAKKPKIKRPMNAFMVWAKKNRVLLSKKYPGMTNADISVMLGERWSRMTSEEKHPYFQEADQIKEQHKRDFPDWTYQPKPKRRRFLANGSKSYFFEVTKNVQGSYTTRHISGNDLVMQQLPAQVIQTSPVEATSAKPLERQGTPVMPGNVHYIQAPVMQTTGQMHSPNIMAASGMFQPGSVRFPAHLMTGGGIILAQPGPLSAYPNQGTMAGAMPTNNMHQQISNLTHAPTGNIIFPQHQMGLHYVKDQAMTDGRIRKQQQPVYVGNKNTVSSIDNLLAQPQRYVTIPESTASNKDVRSRPMMNESLQTTGDDRNLAMGGITDHSDRTKERKRLVTGAQPVANLIPVSERSKSTNADMADRARRVLHIANNEISAVRQ